jgi:flagellar FliL protein
MTMADAEAAPDMAPKKKSKIPFILGIVFALMGGGGAFFAVYSGMILAPDVHENAEPEAGPLPDIAFVAVDPVTISLGPAAAARHLRFTAQLEVAKDHSAEVTLLMPRILDVLNSYLRAVEVAQLEDPAALLKLRAQMLRRIQIVTGEGRVRDLLITEFVLN